MVVLGRVDGGLGPVDDALLQRHQRRVDQLALLKGQAHIEKNKQVQKIYSMSELGVM